MSNKDSVTGWITLFAILVLTTLVAAVWPLLAGAIGLPGGGGGAAGVSVPTVTLPFAVGGATEMNGLLALGVLTVAVIALVAGMGAVLGFIYVFLNRQTDTIKESEAFQTHQAALAQQEKAQIERLRAGRTTHPVPEHKMPRWSVLSTSLIVLFFTVMLGTLLVEVLIPVDTLWAIGELLTLNARTTVVVALLVVATAVLAWRMRPSSLDAIEATDYGPVPWDSFWIIVTGFLIVGLGIGAVVYLNAPG